ncbi:hypothetical protein LCGC14_1322430 [marine sediment metagenome]|uniref:Portal protein n=1 Tax=marine sediment metagenome TaxID=412755 RepID=A0A0F9MZW4_9ZZZZ
MLQRLPDSPSTSRFTAARMRAAEMVAGASFEQKYARRVALAVEHELGARESTFLGGLGTNGTLPITASSGSTVSQPGDVLQLAKNSFNAVGGPLKLMRMLADLQTTSWTWWHIEPIVGNILATWTALVIGNGVDITIEDDQRRFDGSNAKQAWDEFDTRNDYAAEGGRVWDAAFNTFLFGEWFHWFIPDPSGGPWPTIVRGLDPISKGGIRKVITDPNDFELPTEYTRRGALFAPIPAEEISHWRLALGGNQTRGRPIIERAFDDIFRLQQTRLSTWMLQEYRMRIMVQRYIREKSSAAELPLNIQMPAPLTIQEVPPGAKIEDPDLSKTVIGRSGDNTPEKLLHTAIAQAVFLPLHIVTQEFREANLASLIAAEGPTAKMAELFRSRLERAIRADVRQVVGNRQPNGDALEISVNIKPVIIRDEFKERESWLSIREAREVSQMTFHEKVGLDPEIEKDRMREEGDDNDRQIESANPFGIEQLETEEAREAYERVSDEISDLYLDAGRPYGGGKPAALMWWRDQNGGAILPSNGVTH